MQDVLSLKDHQ